MNADPREYYDRFSTSYNVRRSRGYHAVIDAIEADAIPRGASLRILEAGCGTGLVMDRVRSGGTSDLFGIDLSAGMLAVARQHRSRVAQASVTALPFRDASFDVAYSFKVLAHVPDIHMALQEMARVVRPGGTIVVEFYNRHSLRGLRWLLKRMFGGESTGERQRETELFTRYDTVTQMIGYLPAHATVAEVRGAIIATPAAAAMRVPGLGALLSRLERRLATSFLARYGGFVIVVARRI
jgi:ubiquinone/menaquinone biosynthesis C-methylase UbiE